MKTELLEKEINRRLLELENLDISSEEYKVSVDTLTKLIDRSVEIDKNDDEKKDRKIRNGISIAGIIIPTCVTIWGTIKTIRFEESGTLTTTAGRSFVNRIFRK